MLLMPDHLHALVQVPERLKLSHVIASWKSYLTKNLGIGGTMGSLIIEFGDLNR
jgi:REP element-mobilizing transposase RayT